MSRQPSIESFPGLGGGGVTDEHKSGHEPETVVLSQMRESRDLKQSGLVGWIEKFGPVVLHAVDPVRDFALHP
jgi:hypothetical protein